MLVSTLGHRTEWRNLQSESEEMGGGVRLREAQTSNWVRVQVVRDDPGVLRLCVAFMKKVKHKIKLVIMVSLVSCDGVAVNIGVEGEQR